MYEGPRDEKAAFIASLKAQRETRESEQRRTKAAVQIQVGVCFKFVLVSRSFMLQFVKLEASEYMFIDA